MLLYNFDGNVYSDHEDGRQAILEDLHEHIEITAADDPETTSEAEIQEIISTSMEGSYIKHGTFWDGLMIIMQRCPYELGIRKLEVTVEPSGGEELTEIEKMQIAELVKEDQ